MWGCRIGNMRNIDFGMRGRQELERGVFRTMGRRGGGGLSSVEWACRHADGERVMRCGIFGSALRDFRFSAFGNSVLRCSTFVSALKDVWCCAACRLALRCKGFGAALRDVRCCFARRSVLCCKGFGAAQQECCCGSWALPVCIGRDAMRYLANLRDISELFH
jgi:hypothetical protein